MQSSGKDKVSQEVVIQLVASIDWLLVLYNASDTLHNGLDVAGIELSHSFVPEVFYLEMKKVGYGYKRTTIFGKQEEILTLTIFVALNLMR